MSKKEILFVALITVLLIETVIIWASGTQDYRTVQFYDDNDKDVFKPTAQFSLNHDGTSYNSPAGTNLDSFAVVVNATVGDTVSIKDKSHSNRGQTLRAWDFQYTRPDGNNQFISTKAFEKSYTLDIPGTYTFSLCVRDTVEDEAWTNYWGNWSDNGNHQVIGNNPGKDPNDPSDDFDGYWYFTRIVVIARDKSYTLEEKHIDTSSGKVLNSEIHNGITENSFTTTSKNFDDYKFVGSRAGYTWSEIVNGTTENITTRTANFDSTHRNALHYYYYKKSLPPPPPPEGKADIFICYKDKITGAAVYPADETTYKAVSYGTYIITALPAPEGYTFDNVITPSPQTVTVDADNNAKSITFLYNPQEAPPANEPPVARVRGPNQQMAGENVTYYGNDSYDPDGTIVNYSWDYPDANLSSQSTKGDRLTAWYPYEGNYTRSESVELTVADDTGNTDSDSHSIDILPPIPEASLNISGIYKENRKVTLDASLSRSPSRYPLDSYIWTISNPANVKSIAPLNNSNKNYVLYKAAGTYSNKISVTNTVGLSAEEEKSVTIVPDKSPVTDFAVITKLLRDPNDSNNVSITISNLTVSPDGDPIKKTVMFYAYDSDNDGDFNEEAWKYSTNGTAWQNAACHTPKYGQALIFIT